MAVGTNGYLLLFKPIGTSGSRNYYIKSHDLLLKLCVKKWLEKGKMLGGILLGCCRDYSGLTTYMDPLIFKKK